MASSQKRTSGWWDLSVRSIRKADTGESVEIDRNRLGVNIREFVPLWGRLWDQYSPFLYPFCDSDHCSVAQIIAGKAS